MPRYPLQSLLTVRVYREEAAKRKASEAEAALAAALREVERLEKELEEWRIWRKEEEERRYDSIMGTLMKVEEIDKFKAGLAKLAAEEAEKTLGVRDARNEAGARQKECEAARAAVSEARKNISKIEAHRDIWQEEDKKEAERQADLELEEFKPISRKGAEAEGEDQ